MTWIWPEHPAPAPIPIVGIAQPLGDRRGQLLRDELEHDRERARLLDRERVGEQRPRLVACSCPGPGPCPSALIACGVEPDVAHDRDAGLDDRLDDPRAPHAALDLDRLDARPRA